MKRQRGSVRFDAYYKAQWWDATSLAWRDVQRACASPEEARALFDGEHTWRVMEVTPTGRHPLPHHR